MCNEYAYHGYTAIRKIMHACAKTKIKIYAEYYYMENNSQRLIKNFRFFFQFEYLFQLRKYGIRSPAFSHDLFEISH